LIGSQSISSLDNKIADQFLQVFLDLALDKICETHYLITDPEADGTGRFSLWQTISAGPRVNARSGQFRPAAATTVSLPTVEQISNGEFMYSGPLALVQHGLIRPHSKPFQIPQNPVCTSWNFPWRVDVLNPDQPLATR
jgi:hypothetical protein